MRIIFALALILVSASNPSATYAQSPGSSSHYLVTICTNMADLIEVITNKDPETIGAIFAGEKCVVDMVLRNKKLHGKPLLKLISSNGGEYCVTEARNRRLEKVYLGIILEKNDICAESA